MTRDAFSDYLKLLRGVLEEAASSCARLSAQALSMGKAATEDGKAQASIRFGKINLAAAVNPAYSGMWEAPCFTKNGHFPLLLNKTTSSQSMANNLREDIINHSRYHPAWLLDEKTMTLCWSSQAGHGLGITNTWMFVCTYQQSGYVVQLTARALCFDNNLVNVNRVNVRCGRCTCIKGLGRQQCGRSPVHHFDGRLTHTKHFARALSHGQVCSWAFAIV